MLFSLTTLKGTPAGIALMHEKLPSHSITSGLIMRAAWVGLVAGGFLILLGGTVLTGWVLRLPSLLQLLPGPVAMVFNTPDRMAPNTALAFLLAGTGIILLPRADSLPAWRMIELPASVIILIGLTGAVGLVVGLGGFAIMQQRTETTLQNGLLRSLQSRNDFLTPPFKTSCG